MHQKLNHLSFVVLYMALQAIRAEGQESVTPGELHIERPTLRSLGFEWIIDGDENRNAYALVRYRAIGSEQWRLHLPLYRTGGFNVTPMASSAGGSDPRHNMPYTLPNSVCGSILNLEPGVTYEVALKLEDPDGVEGEPVQMLTLTTRGVPRVMEGTEVRHVYPYRFDGPKQEPAYRSIMHAVNGFNPIWDNFQTVHTNPAPPGTIIKLHAGTYSLDTNHYREPTHQRWLTGTIFLTASGTPEAPIVIMAAGDGEVVIDGDGAHQLFNVRSADYLHFEGLTIRNCDIAFFAGYQGERGGGSKGLTVRNCWIEGVVYGILAQDGRSEDFYIADNVILGRNPYNRLNPSSGGAYGHTDAGYAVNLSGQGHVIEHNYVANFWDALNVFTNALADPALQQQARAIDFHDNIVFNSTDNHLETDGSYANIRVQRNWFFNVMAHDASTQPNYAGPSYFIRNVFWNGNGTSSLKPDGGTPRLIFLHNTCSSGIIPPLRTRSLDIRNNVFASPVNPTRRRHSTIASYPDQRPSRQIDYNAYRIGFPGKPFKVGQEHFTTVAAMANATGYEIHGQTFEDYRVFQDAPEPPYASSNQQPLVHPQEVDITPASTSLLIDAGVLIPGINDRYTGRAPDIGAVERGQPHEPPGPRSSIYAERLQELRTGDYKPIGTE